MYTFRRVVPPELPQNSSGARRSAACPLRTERPPRLGRHYDQSPY